MADTDREWIAIVAQEAGHLEKARYNKAVEAARSFRNL